MFCQMCDETMSFPPHQFKHTHPNGSQEKYWACHICVQTIWPEWARNSGKTMLDEDTLDDFELHMVSVCRRLKETEMYMSRRLNKMVSKTIMFSETQ